MKMRLKKLKSIPVTKTKTPEVKLHCSCKTLILEPFIQAHCNKDYSGLIISGEPTPQQLHEAWNAIVFEYVMLIQTSDNDVLLNMQKELKMLEWHITFVDINCSHGNIKEDICPGFLRLRYDPELINELTVLGYNISAEFGTIEYDEQLNLVISLCKRIVFDHEELSAQLDMMQNIGNGKAQTEESFYQTVAMLSKFQHYRIDKNVITVDEFASVYTNYVNEIKST